MSLLRPVNDPLPEGCHCQPGRCMAPKVMGAQMPCRDTEKAKAHVLVEIIHAEQIFCVMCKQTFKQTDKYTACPNALDGSHALIPKEWAHE